jgi:hypothetical protein
MQRQAGKQLYAGVHWKSPLTRDVPCFAQVCWRDLDIYNILQHLYIYTYL